MLSVKIICVGNLKEQYLRDAVAEYKKRLSAFCTVEIVELKEYRLPADPSCAQIAKAVEDEGRRILACCPAKTKIISLCVEGKQISSEEFAEYVERLSVQSGCICFIIGGSYGLWSGVKNISDLCLSFSKLTFPHQLMRVILLESLYRCFNIIKGTRYHK